MKLGRGMLSKRDRGIRFAVLQERCAVSKETQTYSGQPGTKRAKVRWWRKNKVEEISEGVCAMTSGRRGMQPQPELVS